MTQTVVPARESLAELASAFEERTAHDVIAWAIATYRERLTIACSFGGASGMVILDIAMQIDRSIPVHYLDTGLLFEATYATVDAVAARYGITPVAIRPALTPEQQAEQHGPELWARDPDACCNVRKVEPQREFLRGYGAWITGLRRDQAATRSATPIVQWDDTFGLVKINPLARWSEDQTRAYVRQHDLVLNPLLDRGYPSIGCWPCTRAAGAGESGRAGRWSGSGKIECGLHYQITTKEST